MFGWLRKMFAGRPAAPGGPSRAAIQARFEAAQTSSENAPLWAMTDYLSARAANSFQVRRTLKIRSRYEAANNSYYRGMIDTLADDLVGKGPRLQVRSGNTAVNKAIEKRFHEWAESIGLGEDLRTMAKSKVQDGEGFGLCVTNPTLRKTFGGVWTDVDDAVQLDLCPIESDQVTTPDPGFLDVFWVDGMVLDRLGNPTEYHVLRTHPGDLFLPGLNPMAYDKWRPGDVLQWFRKDRPGQCRGIPEIASALELFAQLRRYTKAVLAAAECAADVAALLESEAPADGDTIEPEPFEQMQIDRGAMVTLPAGYKMSQIKAEQPAQSYEMFVRVLVREIARCLDVPLSIALGDTSDSNYSSARLEHLRYHRRQQVDRSLCEAHCLRKLFAAWYKEALLVAMVTPGYLPANLPREMPAHRWLWPRAGSIDPVKDATADGIELENGTTTLADIYAARGEDWEEKIAQRGRELVALRQAGLAPAEPEPKTVSAAARRRRRQLQTSGRPI